MDILSPITMKSGKLPKNVQFDREFSESPEETVFFSIYFLDSIFFFNRKQTGIQKFPQNQSQILCFLLRRRLQDRKI